MGKYSAFRKKFPEAPVDIKWQAKVNLVRQQEINGKPLAEIGTGYNSVRMKKEQLEEELKDLNIQVAAYEQEMVSQLESQGLEQVRLKDGTLLSIKDDVYCSVGDRLAFHKWLEENEMLDLLTVNYQTMSGMVKDRLVQGKPVPPGVKTFSKTGIRRTAPKT